MKLDSQGNIVTQLKYSVPYEEDVEDIVIDRDGNYVVFNNDEFPPLYDGGTIVTKLSPSFEVLGRKGYIY